MPKPLIPLPSVPMRKHAPARAFSGGRVDGSSANGVAQVEIYGDIGLEGVHSANVRQWLAGLSTGGDVELTLNSGGGDVFEGIAIYNDLAGLPGRVTVRVTGLAASAASLVAMAGDRIILAENAMMMLHNAWMIAEGDRRVFAEISSTLEKADENMAATYAARSGLPVDRVRAMMDAETWLSPREAVELGFADEVQPIAPRGAHAGSDALRVTGQWRPRGRSEAFLQELRAARTAGRRE